jgi:DNA-binding transcriptional MerR regulator
MTEPTGRFRINWVADNTGVAEATLRAWERRYQVPKPARTPSGYRLYSEADVAQVQRMRELCEAGVAPADAAQQILRDHDVDAVPPERKRPSFQASTASSGTEGSVAAGTDRFEDIHLTEVVGPQHTNAAGVLSLRSAIELMERAACITVARKLRRTAVVVSCGGVDLLAPVGLAQLVNATARLVQGRGEMISVDVRLEVESVETGQREHIARSTLLLVLVEPGGSDAKGGAPEP